MCLVRAMPAKRKSQGGDKASSKNAKVGRADVDKLSAKPYIAQMTAWFLGSILVQSRAGSNACRTIRMI